MPCTAAAAPTAVEGRGLHRCRLLHPSLFAAAVAPAITRVGRPALQSLSLPTGAPPAWPAALPCRLSADGRCVELVALRPLQTGDEATISYTGPAGMTNQRLMAQYGELAAAVDGAELPGGCMQHLVCFRPAP